MDQQASLDKLVAKVAGAICASFLEHPAINQISLVMSSGVTFKVKNCLAKMSSLKNLTEESKRILVKDIQNAVISVLFTYEIDPVLISTIAPGMAQIIEKSLSESNSSH